MKSLGERVAARRKQLNMSQTELGRRSGYGQQSIDAIEKGRVERPRKLREIADALGRTQEWFLGENERFDPPRLVAVVGYVGAGDQIFSIDDHAPGAGLEEIEAPPGLPPEATAVRVRGDSMRPAYENGDVLFYSRQVPPSDLLQRKVIIGLPDGRRLVKILLPAAGRKFNLMSINPSTPPIIGVIVEWAAPIDWVKPRS